MCISTRMSSRIVGSPMTWDRSLGSWRASHPFGEACEWMPFCLGDRLGDALSGVSTRTLRKGRSIPMMACITLIAVAVYKSMTKTAETNYSWIELSRTKEVLVKMMH